MKKPYKYMKNPSVRALRAMPLRIIWHMILKRKILVISTCVILFFLPIAYLTTRYQSKTEAAWMNDQWGYRQTVAITNSGAAQTDFQVSISVDTATLITAGKMQSDCDDIRITDVSGKILANWIETGTNACNTATTAIWTKVPSISTTGTTVYLYYGNSSAVSTQNGNQVFLFFDDFAGSTINTSKWNNTTGTITLSSGVASLGLNSHIANTNFDFRNYSAAALEGRAKVLLTAQRANIGVISSSYFNMEEMGSHPGFNHLWWNSGSTYKESGNDASAGSEEGWFGYTANWNRLSLKWISGTSVAFTSEGNSSTKVTNIPTTSSPVALNPNINNRGYSSSGIDVDFIFVRKYAATEPSVGTPSNEQKSQGPVAYWKFDEGYGTTPKDSSPNNYTSSFSGAPTWKHDSECISGKCLYFDGSDDYVNIPTGPTFGTGDFTISVWAKYQNVNSQGGNPQSIIANATHACWAPSITEDWGNLKFFGSDASVFPGSISSLLNQWHYFTYVKQGNNVTAYVDGINKGTASNPNMNVTNGNWHIGDNGHCTGTVTTFKGYIDEIKLYNYARSTAQIKSDFAAKGSGSVKGTSAALGVSSKNNDALSNGLVGYWKMDEASWNGTAGEVIDSSGNGNNGTANCGGTCSKPTTGSGKFGNGGVFDGVDDYVGINYTNPTTATSVVAWFKRLGVPAGGYHIITGGANVEISINEGGGYIRTGVTTATQGRQVFNSGSGLVDGNWHQVAMTYDGTNLVSFIDGTQTASNPVSGSLSGIADEIGRYLSNSYAANGRIDEVRIYNRALSPREVRDLYNFAPGPKAYYSFDEGSGTTLRDTSGNGYDSTSFTGSPTWTAGKFGKALYFNGSSAVTLPASIFSKKPQQITMEIWLKGEGQPTNSSIFQAGPNQKINVHAPWGDNNLYWDYGESCCTGRIAKTMDSQYMNGNWTHFAFVSDSISNSMKIYANGVLWHSGAVSQTMSNAPTNFFLGAYDTTQYYYRGWLDEFKIYDYPRTQKQIVEDMNAGHPVGGSPVGSQTLYWKMDEGQGPKASGAVWSQMGSTTNLILNPSLETGTTSWGVATNGDGTISRDTSSSVYGSYELKTTATTGSETDARYSLSGLTPSTAYSVSAYMKTASTGCSLLIIVDTGTGQTGTSVSVSSTNEWNRYTLNYTTPANATGTGYIDAPRCTGTFPKTVYTDALQFQQATTTTAYCDGSLTGNGTHSWSGTAHASTSTCTYGQDGEIRGPTWSNAGKFGKALSFDGNNDFVKSDPQIDFPVQLTFSGWINPTSAASTAYVFNPVGGHQGGGSVPNAQMYVYMNTNRTLSANIWTVTPGSQWETTITTTNTVPLSQWSYVAYTFDGSKQKIYLNGKLEAQTSGTTTGTEMSDSGSQRVYLIGAAGEDDGFTSPFTGLIDEVKIYSSALTSDEIALDYNRGASMVLGSTSTDSSGNPGDNSSDREYCIPGDTTSCSAPIIDWELNEKTGTTAYDSTGNSNNGTFKNNVLWGVGKYGGGVVLDGTSAHIDGPVSKISSTGTYEMWVNLNDTTDRYAFAFDTGPDVAPGCVGQYGWFNGSSNFTANNYDGNPGWVTLTSTTTFTTNTWYHIAVVTQSGTNNYKLYVNGKLEAQGTTTSINTFGQFTIGSYHGDCVQATDDSTNPINGSMDQIRYFNYVRTPAQIAYDYNRGAPIAHYKFDECQGITANDSSGNGNSGTITIGATVPQTSVGTCTVVDTATAWYNGATGKYNSSLRFDGVDDYMTRNMSVSASDGTVAFWVKDFATGAGPYLFRSDANVRTYVGVSGTTIYFYKGNPAVQVTSTPNLTTSNWNHVVLKWWTSGGTQYAEAYANGISTGSPVTFSDTSAGSYITVAGFSQTGTQNAAGQIDDVRVFNYALTAQQIKSIFNQGSGIRFGPSTGSP